MCKGDTERPGVASAAGRCGSTVRRGATGGCEWRRGTCSRPDRCPRNESCITYFHAGACHGGREAAADSPAHGGRRRGAHAPKHAARSAEAGRARDAGAGFILVHTAGRAVVRACAALARTTLYPSQ
eukprot:scaffold8877_cov112-Isochrysis_galbana.AAC.12